MAMRNATVGLETGEEEEFVLTLDPTLSSSIKTAGKMKTYKTDPNHCLVRNTGLASYGEEASFEIIAYDSAGERRTDGWDRVEVDIPHATEIKVSDRGDGTYLVSYRAPPETEASEGEVEVALDIKELTINVRVGRPGCLLPQCPLTVRFQGIFYGIFLKQYSSDLMVDGHCVAVDDVYLYVSDFAKNQILTISRATGEVRVLLQRRPSSVEDFREPWGIAVDDELLYLVDSANRRLQVYEKRTAAYVRTILLSMEWAFAGARMIVYNDGRLYVSDADKAQVVVLNAPTGAPILSIGGPTASTPESVLDRPLGVAVDETHLYVVERGTPRVKVFDKTSGEYVRIVGGRELSDGGLRRLTGIAVVQNMIIVSDCEINRLVLFDKVTGAFKRTLNQFGPEEEVKNLKKPWDLKVFNGQLFICDGSNRRIIVLN